MFDEGHKAFADYLKLFVVISEHTTSDHHNWFCLLATKKKTKKELYILEKL